MEELYMQCFQIIAAVGTARSMYIQAIQEAKEGNLEQARKTIDEGEQIFVDAHRVHMEMISKEAAGEKTDFALILLHAEDQLMSAETMKIVATEFIDLYEKVGK